MHVVLIKYASVDMQLHMVILKSIVRSLLIKGIFQLPQTMLADRPDTSSEQEKRP